MTKTRMFLIIIGFALMILGIRFYVMATSINTMHHAVNWEYRQLELSEDLLEKNMPFDAALFMENLDRYLPKEKQFHGMLLLNSFLLVPISIILGVNYYNLHLLALAYHLLVYFCFAFLINRFWGTRAFFFFSVLFLFADIHFVASGLFLMGGHAEGVALIAIMFVISLGINNKHIGALILCLVFGTFFFLYKGVIIAFVLLQSAYLLQKDSWKRVPLLLLVLALGFVPFYLYVNQYGYYAHYLEDGVATAEFAINNTPRLEWVNAFRFENHNFSAIRLPHFESYVFLTAFFIMLVVVFLSRKKLSSKGRLFLYIILAYPLVQWAAMYFSRLPTYHRYYYGFTPLMLAIVALGLSKIKAKYALPFTALISVSTLLCFMPYVHWDKPDLFLRYHAINYCHHGANFVPAREVEFTNWWLANCKDNEGFRFFFNYQFNHFTWIKKPPPPKLKDLSNKIYSFALRPSAMDHEVIALGMALANKTMESPHSFNNFINDLSLPEERKRLLIEGFNRPISLGCPMPKESSGHEIASLP